jgi:hypothetical protein
MQPFTNAPYDRRDRPQHDKEYYVTTQQQPIPEVKMLEYMVKRRRYSGEDDNEGRVYEHYKFYNDDNLYVNGPESVERWPPGAFVSPNVRVFNAGIVIYKTPRPSNGGSKRIKQIRRKRTTTGGRRKRMNYTNKRNKRNKRKTNRTV